jgi:hypothetical protein
VLPTNIIYCNVRLASASRDHRHLCFSPSYTLFSSQVCWSEGFCLVSKVTQFDHLHVHMSPILYMPCCFCAATVQIPSFCFGCLFPVKSPLPTAQQQSRDFCPGLKVSVGVTGPRNPSKTYARTSTVKRLHERTGVA